MSVKLKTPGVYLRLKDEIPPLPTPPETAMPAFIGYTRETAYKGISLLNKATKISNLEDYLAIFGEGPEPRDLTVRLDENNRYTYLDHLGSAGSYEKWHLYRSLRLFYDNGGRECYIVSIGGYEDSPALGNPNDPENDPGFLTGLKGIHKEQEITLILLPDAVLLDQAEFYKVQKAALKQAGTKQDRFCIFDLHESGDLDSDLAAMRNQTGIDNLSYGASYAPFLQHAYSLDPEYHSLTFVASDGIEPVDLEDVSADPDHAKLIADLEQATADYAAIELSLANAGFGEGQSILRSIYNDLLKAAQAAVDAASSETDIENALQELFEYTAELLRLLTSWTTGAPDADGLVSARRLLNQIERPFLKGLGDRVEGLIELILNDSVDDSIWNNGTRPDFSDYDGTQWLARTVAELTDSTDVDYGSDALTAGAAVLAALEALFSPEGEEPLYLVLRKIADSGLAYRQQAQARAYEDHPILSKIIPEVRRQEAMMPPSGAVCGVYALSDGNLGVWRAPANAAIRSVEGLSTYIDHAEQEGMNVDPDSGKSVNAIRAFPGRGILIYGARTLQGNSPEWRYVPVRRLFSYVENNVREIAEPWLFEANDLMTWVRLKVLINVALQTLWERGGLFGSSPAEAFYVKVGLGETMIPQDVYEGRIIIEIGLAALRPAEFIVLEFNFKSQNTISEG